jgi:hypothetical protein
MKKIDKKLRLSLFWKIDSKKIWILENVFRKLFMRVKLEFKGAGRNMGEKRKILPFLCIFFCNPNL